YCLYFQYYDLFCNSTLSLHDALPIYSFGVRLCTSSSGLSSRSSFTCLCASMPTRCSLGFSSQLSPGSCCLPPSGGLSAALMSNRSEEHTSELQSRENLVCRLLLEKKK